MRNTIILLLLVVCWRIAVGNIAICENKTLTIDSVLITKIDKNSSTNCVCEIISETGNESKVIFSIFSYSGHQYKLSVSNGTSTSYFEYEMSPDIFYTIDWSGEITLTFEKNNCSVKDGLEFAINLTSTTGNINITCYNLTVSTPDPCTQTTSESTTTVASIVTAVTSKVKASSSITLTRDVTTTSEVTNSIYSTTSTNTATTSSQNDQTTNSPDTGDLDIGLIAGVVGGAVVLIIIILIILIICLVKRKRSKKDRYDRPSPRLPPNAGYVDVNFGEHGNNLSPDNVIIEENALYHSVDNADSVSSGHLDSNHKTDSPLEMEIIENDLYVSSDDVMNFKSSDDGDTSQIPEVEYAIVNKKPHSGRISTETSVDSGVSTSSNKPNNDQDRNFILGPQVDEYTLVNKL